MSVFRHIPVLLTLMLAVLAPVAQAGTVTVFAAASLKTALDEIAAGWQADTGHEAVLAYAGSSALTRQIEQGAPADLFISANTLWMDHLQAQGLLVADTRRDLVGNRLVLVGLDPGAIDLTDPAALIVALGEGPLAMAFTNAVPAGIYGREALMALHQWDAVRARVAQTDNVRAALALVALGEAPLGVVYASDARADPRVHVRAVFPPDSHTPITYPAAALTDRPEVRALLAYLSGPRAMAVFAANGFTTGADP